MKHTNWSQKTFKAGVAIVAIMLIILCFYPASSWSRSRRFTESHQLKNTQKYDREMSITDRELWYPFDKIKDYTPFDGRRTYPFLTKDYSRNYNRLSPEEKNMLKRRLQEWESLPPERQRILRHRMEQYKRLPPRERHLFQQRYRQLQKLPPDERYKIREKLRRWDTLPPGEREQIRRRFREP
jgi:mRNA-degrading endonuclease RelE of RelBE toxin-antitoxin system